MSGIVGIFRPDGGGVDQALVRALTRFLAYRGPDGCDVWCNGSLGLGHAMLRTTEESAGDRQPCGIEGRFWITADARLDARAELLAQLEEAGRKPERNSPDSQLILHAYAAWGQGCLQRLRGDFAFAIWDAQRKEIFCARDHLGIRPFYFTEHKDFFLFSNTLDCVRVHPDVPDELDESAIADFLLFGLNRDPATTTFRAIRRLPPAHFLRVSAEGLRIERYWSLPVDGRIRYGRADEYVEHFQMLLREAVADRLRGGRAGILLSGGLDSSSIAATARALSPERGESGKLRAYTVTREATEPDSDAPYARQVAAFLGLPHRCLATDGLQPFERWDDSGIRWPEPVGDPLAAGMFDEFRAIAEDCRVVMDGEGPDNLLDFQMWPYAFDLLRQREWRQLCSNVPRFLLVRRMPWRGIRRRLRAMVGFDAEKPVFPNWLDPEFARRVDARARWREGCAPRVSPAHPVKPRAHASMSLPHWTRLFEMQDAGVTRCPVEVRYPFLDLRIVSYMLAIPPFPWAFQKTLLREAMSGHLPESIRRRPKTPLPQDPMVTILRRQKAGLGGQTTWSTEIDQFVRRSAYKAPLQADAPAIVETGVRPLCLNFWLQQSQAIRYNLFAEVRHG